MKKSETTHQKFLSELDKIMGDISESRHIVHSLQRITCCDKCVTEMKSAVELMGTVNRKLNEIHGKEHFTKS